jgi:hypothetical protein
MLPLVAALAAPLVAAAPSGLDGEACPDATFTRPTEGELYPVVGTGVSALTWTIHFCSIRSSRVAWVDASGTERDAVGIGTNCGDIAFEFAFTTTNALLVDSQSQLVASSETCEGTARTDQVTFFLVLATLP